MHRERAVIRGSLVATALALALAAPAQALEVGQKAPNFTLAAPGGKQVKLADLLGKGPVVIYTLIQAFTRVWTDEIMGFEAAPPRFEALGAQVVGVSADHVATLEAFTKQNGVKHTLLSDFRRQMLPAYDALVTDEKSPIFRYAKRAYIVLDREGTVKWVKVMQNPLDLLKTDEVVSAVRESGAR